ncbi:MAG TPA: class I SAM-dependent methyltransferase [Solirubrobacteraceae bacterium]
MLHANRTRAESFGAVAELYDRIRPSYPPELVAALLSDGAHAVLDVGAGTGIAASLFAQAGCEVLAVEIDARMAAVAAAKGIEVEVAPFERWDDRGRRFDLVTSAQAWHWVVPLAGATKAAEVLLPGGVFAAFWNLGEPPQEIHEALDPVYARLAPELASNSLAPNRSQGRVGDTGLGLAASGAFEPEQERWFSWTRAYDSASWVDLLRTHSDHQTLPPQRLESLLQAVAEAIDAAGGSFEMRLDTVLVSARRRLIAA